MRRTIVGSIAFSVFTGALLTVPVYSAPASDVKPVEPAIEEVALGSVEAPADAAIVTTDGQLVEAGPHADVVAATEVEPSPGDAVEVPSSGSEAAGIPVLTVSEPETRRFSAVGVTWAHDSAVGDVTVQIRVRADDGSWGEWTRLAEDDAEQTGEGGDAAVRDGTAPYYTGAATGVEVIVQSAEGSAPKDVQTQLIDPGKSSADTALGAADVRDQAHAGVSMPSVYTRAQWGADESIRSWDPEYSSTVKAATVHHTADSNNYSAAEVPGILRSIYAYHTLSRGWGDIGYNVIVDKFGRAWEGRYSGSRGLSSPIIGAHAGGFNSYTFGVSMLGDYSVAPTTEPMIDMVSKVIAWKLSLYGVNPGGWTSLTSGGGGTAKYAAGTTVTLPTVFGHRDVGNTTCPGQYGYAQLDRVRSLAAGEVAIAAAHDPLGEIDSLTTTESGVTASGWSFDPDATTSPLTVRLAVDGNLVSSAVANQSRPDVAAAFGVGPAHGFTASAALSQGRHTVCVLADNLTGAGSRVELGCTTVTFTNVPPRYSVDVFAEQADGTVTISGWAFDPDGGRAQIHVYDNGVGTALETAGSRPDVQAVYPAAGPTSGWSVRLGPLSGNHSICVFAVDIVAPGNNVLTGCRDLTYQAPRGVVDVVAETTTGKLRVSGWTMDPSVPTASTEVHVYVDGRGTAYNASGGRPDVAAAYPGAGPAHGFDMELAVAQGVHDVCVFAINVGVGGGNLLMQCARVDLRYQAPFGSVDAVTPSSDRVDVRGWALDPSVPSAPVTVHYYVDGRMVGDGVADGSRPDVARAYSGVGAAHGYSRALTVAAGRHQVCVFAINQGVPGANTLMRCQHVTV